MKKCRICAQEKRVDEFYSNPKCIDGRASYCKPCSREKTRMHKLNRKERPHYELSK